MSKHNPVIVNGGLEFSSILTLIFVVAKLSGIIHWSWWLVFLPFYGSIILAISVVLILLLVLAILAFFVR